jgi:hypothetical protein
MKDEMIFVGGSVAELYADNPAASEIRPTKDVDCIIEIHSRLQFAEMEEKLRALGFRNDTSEDAPICRWIYQEIKVDIMPTDPKILGFSNQWYEDGNNVKISKTLPDGSSVSVFPSAYYLAAKLDAHNSRGGNDLRQSHDFEDIIYILDNCTSLPENILSSRLNLKEYLKSEFSKLLTNPRLNEGIESALPYGSSQENTEIIMKLFHSIASIE